MRGTIVNLISPHPIGRHLPALYQDDPFAQRFVAALDEVLAPVICVLDNLEGYVDPQLAPKDFLEWIAEWVGIALDETWPLERRRQLVSEAVELYRWRGTAKGLRDAVAVYTGTDPHVEDTGGSSVSSAPGGDLPGVGEPSAIIRVRVPDPSAVDMRRLDRIVAASKPAHVAHSIRVEPA